ncbi:MAG TPA: YciI family protein [Opitutaceae bacterium]
MRRLLIALLLFPLLAFAAEEKSAASAAPKSKQFVYVLKLTPRLHDDAAWTEADKKTVGAHFAHLQAATKERKVILAGRTMESGDKTFGLVIFEAASDTEAAAFMNSDPAVAAGVMTATVHPYAVVLQRSEK